MRRAIGYCRVSTDKQAEHGVSLEDQETRIRARAVSDAVDLLDVIVDDGYSAKSLDRPGVQRLLGLIRKRQVDVVIVTKLDRLTRSVRDFQDLLDLLDKTGVSLVSMGDSVDTSCAVGRMVLNVTMSVLQWHREEIAEKTAAAMRHKREKGEKTGGKVPYGYDVQIEGDRKVLVPNAAEQAVITAVRAERDAGRTYEQIAEDLNARGFRTREGGLFKRQYVHRILSRKTEEK